MARVFDTHKHISNQQEIGRGYLPWQQNWHACMNWAYGAIAPNQGRPPYSRNPQDLMDKQSLRYADSDGTWTIRDMDDSGVDVSVLLPIDYDYSWGSDAGITIHEKHEHLARMQEKHPGRFVGLAGPDPRRPGSVDILVHGLRDLKLRGLKVIPKMGFYPWDERLYLLYEKCLDYDVPAFICTQPEGGGYNRARFQDPIHLDDVIADYPDLKVVCLHAGVPLYDWFEHALLVCARAANTAISLDMWLRGVEMSMARGFIPNFRTDEEAVVRLIARARDVLGAHRIMWGSDSFSGPDIHGANVFGKATGFGIKELVQFLKDLPSIGPKYGKTFTQDEVDLMLGENAARFLGLGDFSQWQRPHKYGWRRRLPPPFKGGV